MQLPLPTPLLCRIRNGQLEGNLQRDTAIVSERISPNESPRSTQQPTTFLRDFPLPFVRAYHRTREPSFFLFATRLLQVRALRFFSTFPYEKFRQNHRNVDFLFPGGGSRAISTWISMGSSNEVATQFDPEVTFKFIAKEVK